MVVVNVRKIVKSQNDADTERHLSLLLDQEGFALDQEDFWGRREFFGLEETELPRRPSVPRIKRRREGQTFIEVQPYNDELVENSVINLRLSDKLWVTDYFMVVENQKDREFLERAAEKPRIKGKYVCRPDSRGSKFYYFLTEEKILYSPNLECRLDSRSTTGRLGCMSFQASNGDLFGGRILIALQPRVFPIEIEPGITSTTQVVFRYKDSHSLMPEEIRELWGKEVSFYKNGELVDLEESLKEGRLVPTYSTEFFYKAKKNILEPINPNLKAHYESDDFWEEITGGEYLVVEDSAFYLVGMREKMVLGNSVCAELTRETKYSGTGFLSHFAGFIREGYQGQLTLECSSDVRRVVRTGHPVGFLNLEGVEKGTGESSKISSYQDQKSPQLANVFIT